MSEKFFIEPEDLRKSSFTLGKQVVESGYNPNFLVALWRGGTPIGCYVHEYLKLFGKNPIDHISIRTSRYTGIDETKSKVSIDGLEYVFRNAKSGDKVLLVDDVWDAGTTMMAVLEKLKVLNVEVRVAVVYFKPKRNMYDESPEYFVNETEKWLVFPHELEGLSGSELRQHFDLP